jgi:hypothetical protein
MLATKYFGVAEKSQHLAGRAVDVTLDSKLEKTASIARTMYRGGVGWYPQSHFMHIDSGPVRNWTVSQSMQTRSKSGSGKPGASTSGAPVEDFLVNKPKRPLTVQERMKLHKALAKKQSAPR